MVNIATLIAADRLGRDSPDAARGALADAGCVPGEAVWLEPERVCDVPFGGDLRTARAALTGLIGLALADSFVAMIKVMLERRAEREGERRAEREGEREAGRAPAA